MVLLLYRPSSTGANVDVELSVYDGGLTFKNNMYSVDFEVTNGGNDSSFKVKNISTRKLSVDVNFRKLVNDSGYIPEAGYVEKLIKEPSVQLKENSLGNLKYILPDFKKFVENNENFHIGASLKEKSPEILKNLSMLGINPTLKPVE